MRTLKAIILTNSPVNESEQQLLIHTKIKKFAINFHVPELKPDFRITSDYYIIGALLGFCSEKIITTREWVPNDRLIYAGHIPFKGSTLVALVDYLISANYKEILIIGNNSVHDKQFQDRINKEIKSDLEQNSDVKIYQYSHGNFDLPYLSLQEFIKE